MKYIYAAVITPRAEGGYRGSVPDLPGCEAVGMTFGHLLETLTEKAAHWLCTEEEKREEKNIPPAHKYVDYKHPQMCTFLQIDTLKYRQKRGTKAVRRNVSLPAWMDYWVKEKHINCSQVLQQALENRLLEENE